MFDDDDDDDDDDSHFDLSHANRETDWQCKGDTHVEIKALSMPPSTDFPLWCAICREFRRILVDIMDGGQNTVIYKKNRDADVGLSPVGKMLTCVVLKSNTRVVLLCSNATHISQ